MAQISWGKPTIMLGKITSAGTAPTTWVEEFTPVEDSAKLTPTTGDEMKAPVEGGGLEDYKRKKTTYVFEYEVRKTKGREVKIPSVNGVVADEYSVQLIPEDATCPGFLIDRSAVSVEDTWSAADGAKWKFTFNVLDATTTGVTDDVAWGTQTKKTPAE